MFQMLQIYSRYVSGGWDIFCGKERNGTEVVLLLLLLLLLLGLQVRRQMPVKT